MSYLSFFRRLYPYINPYLDKIIITIFAVIIASAFTSALPELTGRIVDNLFGFERKHSQAFFYAVVLFSIGFLSASFTLLHTASNSWVSQQVVFNLRKDVFSKILKLPTTYFDANSTGSILAKITYDIEQISRAISGIWISLIQALAMVIILISYLVYKSWQLSLVLLALMPIIVWSVRLAATKMRRSSQIVQQSMGKLTHLLNEDISAQALVKLYHAQKSEKQRFFNLGAKIRKQRFQLDIVGSLNTAIASVGLAISLSVVVYFSSVYLQMSAGDFLAFFTALTILIKPVKQVININKPLQIALAGAESVFRLLDLEEQFNVKTKELPIVKGNINFKNVNFGYKFNKTILSDINLTIKEGQTIALVGETGSGKSTIVQLLCRFYELDKGIIELEGVDISQLDLEEYRKVLSFVDQSVQLFDTSIAKNIAFGREDMPFAIIKQAADMAFATDFIEKLPDKFDSEIGEDGVQLSGGQRQRLAIARALAKNTPILIFDEATSSLDNKTEKQVQRAIANLRGHKTLIIIAHRLTTVVHADNIVVLGKGRIIEQGKHQYLLRKQGLYAQLYNADVFT